MKTFQISFHDEIEAESQEEAYKKFGAYLWSISGQYLHSPFINRGINNRDREAFNFKEKEDDNI